MKLGFSYKFLFYLLLIVVLAYIVLNYLGNFGIKTSQEGYFGKDPVAIGNFGPTPKKIQEGYYGQKTVTDLKRTGLSLERSQANPLNW